MGLVRSRWTDRALDMPPTSPSAALPADCIHVASQDSVRLERCWNDAGTLLETMLEHVTAFS
jgi:hypothetical protein